MISPTLPLRRPPATLAPPTLPLKSAQPAPSRVAKDSFTPAKVDPPKPSTIYPGGIQVKIPARPGVNEDRGHFELSPLGAKMSLVRANGQAREFELATPSELKRAEAALRAIKDKGIPDGFAFLEPRNLSQDGLYWDAAVYNIYQLDAQDRMELSEMFVHHGWGFIDDTTSFIEFRKRVHHLGMASKHYTFDLNGKQLGEPVPVTREILQEARKHRPGSAVQIPRVEP